MREFLWGAATSSHQIEGYNDKNDWWEWELKGNIEGNARSGAATDHLNRFREDIKLAADLGLNSYRFSIEWSRLEPQEGQWSDEAFGWYKDLLSECEKHKLKPMLTLHHFTSPNWFAKRGGFTAPDAPNYFCEFVKRVIHELGPRIPLWCTFNEPMVLLVGSYLGKFMPPAEFSPLKFSQACQGILKSHQQAYELIHNQPLRSGPWKDNPIQVGIAHNLIDFYADRHWHPLELLFTKLLRKFYNQAWLDAITGGAINFRIPGFIPGPKPAVSITPKGCADFIGINYYTKAYVKWRPRDKAEGISPDFPVGIAFSRRKEPTSEVGWAIHPKGLGRMLRFASHYKLPIYITENGIADKVDKMREAYLTSHLAQVTLAIEGGIDVRGYYHWSLLDNFEWIKGFGPRFGLYEVNYETFERKLRNSGKFLKKTILESSK